MKIFKLDLNHPMIYGTILVGYFSSKEEVEIAILEIIRVFKNWFESDSRIKRENFQTTEYSLGEYSSEIRSYF